MPDDKTEAGARYREVLDRVVQVGTELGLVVQAFNPIGDRILVKRIPPKDREGLIHIPEQAMREEDLGVVVRVAADRDDIPVKPGDVVLFQSNASKSHSIGGDTGLLVLHCSSSPEMEGDVLGYWSQEKVLDAPGASD